MHRSCLRVIFVFLFIISGLLGQNLSIQGVARDNSGQSLSNGSYGFAFRLYNVETGGSEVWTENQTLEVLNGVFSVILGEVNTMAGIDFDAQYWLSVEIDGNGELVPRTRLIVSPYAIMAAQENQDNVFPLSGNVGIGVSAPTVKLDVAGSIRGNMDAVHNVWLQGGTGSSGTDRNLALVGFKESDRLHLNYNGEYTGGTIIGGKVGIGTTAPQSPLHVVGPVQISNASFPIGITSQLGGTTPLFNFDANFLFSNRNTTYRGGAFRLDTRGGSSYPMFQWLSRAAGSEALPMQMSLTEEGNLTVNGDIKLGETGEYGAVAASAGQTKIIYGWVSASGTVEYGSGFTASRVGAGIYDVTFTPTFSGLPAFTVNNIGGGAGADNTWYLSHVGNTYVRVVNIDRVNQSNEDSRFNFIAVGPR